MKILKKYFERLEVAILNLEKKHNLVLEAKKNMKIMRNLENEIIKLKKEKVSSQELIDQAIEEIKILKSNVIKEKD